MKKGFTLIELIIAVAISSLLAGISAASFIAIQRITVRGGDDLEVAQTARVIIDRISRDLRQALTMVNPIPAEQVDGLTSLEFEDGHQVNPAGPTYITYSLEGTTVRRRRHYYYNQSNPTQYLAYNAGVVGQNGFNVADVAGENFIIAEGVRTLTFYGDSSLIKIDTVIQSGSSLASAFHSAVAKRNQ